MAHEIKHARLKKHILKRGDNVEVGPYVISTNQLFPFLLKGGLDNFNIKIKSRWYKADYEDFEFPTQAELDKEEKERRANKEYALCEAVADITQLAGIFNYYSGNSREDIANFISWAKEFEALHESTEWGIALEYMDEIEKFVFDKIKKK